MDTIRSLAPPHSARPGDRRRLPTARAKLRSPPGVRALRARRARNLAACAVVGLGLALSAPMASAAVPDLETLTAPQAQAMMESGELTSVELTRAYLQRIEALNKRGPGLNAVTQLNQDALEEAAQADRERAQGIVRGPAHGMPVLMKDLLDVKGMYTSAGNYSLRNSFPQNDSGVVRKLRENGVVILGKTGLSEYANYFGNQPSGFANLTGQVLNGIDADQNPSGSSSGTGSAAAAAMSLLTIGTETSGSIISPARANGIVGIRPTIGLVPGDGIAPIMASQDTAGPMDRTVSDAAFTLQSIVEPNSEVYDGLWDPRPDEDPSIGPGDPRIDNDDIIPPAPSEAPDYLSALDPDFVQGKRIGYNGDVTTPGPLQEAYDALVAAGAIMVERPTVPTGSLPSGVFSYEAKRDITRYYENLGPDAPIKSLEEEIAANQAEPHQALKFGNNTHLSAFNNNDLDPSSASAASYRNNLRVGKILTQGAINAMMENETPEDASDDFIAILGSVPQGARAGFPVVALPMGYSENQRRAGNTQAVLIHGNAYSERDLIGVAYVIEQATQKRQSPAELNPSMYRCAPLDPAPPFSERRSCNPTFEQAMALAGDETILDFALENASAEDLQQRMGAGTLNAEELTKAYLTRIAYANAEGPSVQAVRSLRPNAVRRARALDRERALNGPRGPLHGIPVLVDDSMDVRGLPTTAGSIALQTSRPAASASLVQRLEAQGAIILGKTNVTELSGTVDPGMPTGYSSLGGQVLLPSDADKPKRGSSGGSAAATASGLAAMTVGLQTSPDSAQFVPAASAAGVVAIKPTVGLVSRAGILPVARTQDSPGPITRTVSDAAAQLGALAGPDPADPATTGAPTAPNYVSALDVDSLAGARVATVAALPTSGGGSVNTANQQPQIYASAIEAVEGLGADTEIVSVSTPLSTASIVYRELKRDLDDHLSGVPGPGAKSLAAIVAYNEANPIEGLKYQQRSLEEAAEVDLSDPTTAVAYKDDRVDGIAEAKGLIDGLLANGGSDDFDAIMVPLNTNSVGNRHLPEVVELLEAADRAGYPVLTVPAGFGLQTSNQGRNPYGVAFISTAFSEEKLLSFGFAFEQKTQVRSTPEAAPSWTNPSMWRCVPGSFFFTQELCHPGDRLYTGLSSTTPLQPVPPPPVTPPGPPPVTPPVTPPVGPPAGVPAGPPAGVPAGPPVTPPAGPPITPPGRAAGISGAATPLAPSQIRGLRAGPRRGQVRVINRIQLDQAGSYTFVYVNKATGRRMPWLPGSTVGRTTLRRVSGAPVVRNTTPGRRIVLSTFFNPRVFPARGVDLELRVIHRSSGGSLSSFSMDPLARET